MKRKSFSTPILSILGILVVAPICFQEQYGIHAFSPGFQYQYQYHRTTTLLRTVQGNDNDNDKDWFQQKSGESDVAYIKRITSSAPPAKKDEPKEKQEGGGGGYQRIEDWEAKQQEARKNGDLTWEEKVQFDGQRFGNQVRQNDILMRQINAGL